MLTPPLAALYAYLDNRQINDRGGAIDRVLQQSPQFSFRIAFGGTPIPLADTLNPAHANYMTWHTVTGPPMADPPECQVNPRVYTANTTALFGFIYGNVDNFGTCQRGFGTAAQFADSEFESWRMVTIRRPGAGEQATAFYDLDAMRGAKELVLRVPRVGFFSTPAFFANWATNTSNQARVTMNQTLIVAMGKSFDDTNNTIPITETALDGAHAGPGTTCYGCHRTLDPMRQAFRQAYTLAYHEQLDASQNLVNGVFAFDGVTKQLSGIYDLADTMAAQPRFSLAWAQKLCTWANSAPCVEDDPEFVRVADRFQKSGYDFKVLVGEMLTSPLFTMLADTKTFADNGVTVSVARRDQWCASLSARVGIADVCGASGAPVLSTTQRRVQTLSAVIATDGYSRGSELATISNDPNLFFRASTENICRTIADAVVDAPWRVATPARSRRRPSRTSSRRSWDCPPATAAPPRRRRSSPATTARPSPLARRPSILSSPPSCWRAWRPPASGRDSRRHAMTVSRREALLQGLFGAGYVGLRALATGLPTYAFLRPGSSLADACTSDKSKAQYLILSTSSSGDPMNGNVPGTYDDPKIIHPPDPLMARTDMTMGGQKTSAARPWATLPQPVLERTVFFHHTTLTNSHANQSKVMRLMGAIKRQEMLASLLARQLAPCLGTVQAEPAVLGAAGPGEFLSYQGRTLPSLPPTALRDVLITPAGPIAQLQQMRDRDLDRLSALYKERGTPAQRQFLDRLARSQTEVRAISQNLLSSLASIVNNGIDGQLTAAVALIQMNISPVVSIRLPFGGDNHGDVDLKNEAAQHLTSIAAIASLQEKLAPRASRTGSRSGPPTSSAAP